MDHAVRPQVKAYEGYFRNRYTGTSIKTITSAPAAAFLSSANRSSAGKRFAISSQAMATPDKAAPITRPSFNAAWDDRCAIFGGGGMGPRLAKLWPRDADLYCRAESAFISRVINRSHSI